MHSYHFINLFNESGFTHLLVPQVTFTESFHTLINLFKLKEGKLQSAVKLAGIMFTIFIMFVYCVKTKKSSGTLELQFVQMTVLKEELDQKLILLPSGHHYCLILFALFEGNLVKIGKDLVHRVSVRSFILLDHKLLLFV